MKSNQDKTAITIAKSLKRIGLLGFMSFTAYLIYNVAIA